MKNVFNKIKKLSIHKKLRILSIFLIFAVLSFCVTAYLKTYSEYVSNPNNLNGVNGEYVYINDADADWYFYMGRNYTSNNGQLPTFADKNLYNENNLVETTVTYNGRDILYNQTGYVSNTEQQNKYVYYRFFPVNNNGTANDTSDDYIEIELIDTPFTARPNNLAFNGWITNYAGATITLDMDYYLRYAKVPVTYQNNKPKHIDITFTANWIPATASEMTTSWSTAFGRLNSVSMVPVTTHTQTYNYSMNGYYTAVGIDWDGSCRYHYDDTGTYISNRCTCYDYNGCTYYDLVGNENYDPNKEYYELVNNHMTLVDPDDLGITPIITYLNPYASSSNMAGYFREKDLNPGSSRVGYYDDDGTKLTGNCPNNGNCTVYELIQYYKPGTNEQEKLDLDETYYYLVTRDTNIVYMTRSYSGNWGTNNAKPFTLTSLHNGTKYNVTWTLNNTYVRCTTDTRIENITIETRASYQVTSSPSSSSTASRYFYGNFYNVKIGRGVVSSNSSYATFLAALGGNNSSASSGSSGSPHRYTFAVESGFYGNMSLTNASNSNSSHYTIYTEMKGVYGNDYDRVKKDNTKLLVYYCASGSWNDNYYASSNTKLLFDLTVKSGRFGLYKTEDTSGIYVGGRTGGTHNAARRAKIEGGDIFSLIGGPLSASSQASYNDTYIDMVGGEVAVMIGGAGETATYGNRILQITGGTVSHAVFGGSNGFESGEGNGTVNGSSYIYVGGKATIGDTTLDQEDDNLYGEEIGSVFGIGNGRSGYSSIGSSDNSYIVIADKATINQSVYGGGNFGATGVSSTSNTSESKIKIIGGTIKGSVYGGGNSNGSGNSSKTSSISIEMTSGKVEGSIYGGSNKKGTVYGSTSVNVTGGTVSGNVYGGGKGGYTDSNNPGTFVTRAVSVVVGDSSSSVAPTITGSVYGGSAFGTVNGGSNTTNVSSYNTTVTVNKGTITNVFGGGQGDSTYTPYVEGNVTVTINNGTITNVYGGNDMAGTPNGTVTVNVNNGTISNSVYGGGNQAGVGTTHVNLNGGTATNAYGGSNQAGATTTNIKLNGATVTNLYGGSNQAGDITTTNVNVVSGRAGTIYGGNNSGGTVTTTNVTVGGGTITTAVYGGGKSAPVRTSNVNLNASTIPNVFGGGQSADVLTATYVRLNGSNVTNIYGGSDSTGDVTASNVTVTTGTVGTIYGGNNLGGSTTTTTVTVNGGNVTKVYGGGKQATAGTTNVNLNASSITSAFGGGESANVTVGTNVTVAGANVTTLYGGSDSTGTVAETNVLVMAGGAGTVYGGNNLGGTTTTSEVSISGGNVTHVYGGGNVAATTTSNVIITSPNTISEVYGGGKSANVTTTNVTLTNAKVSNLYGGSNTSGTVNQSNITVNGTTSQISVVYGGNNAGGTTNTSIVDINGGSVGNIYGGGKEAITGATAVDISNTTITGNVYGGGDNAGVTGNVGLSMATSSVGGTVYGGGNLGAVGGNTSVDLAGTTVTGSVYGGGNNAGVTGNVTLNITSSSAVGGTVYGGGNLGVVGGSTDVEVSATTVTGAVFGGGNNARVTGDVNLDVINSTVTTHVYGGGNSAGVTGDIDLDVISSNVGGTVYGGGNLGAVSGNTDVYISTATVGGSVYAGGNGVTAIVSGNSDLNIDGATSITGSVFGGGNAADTGTELADNSVVTVNIAGATIGGNVYGGANTAKIYGSTVLNIGKNAVNKQGLTTGNIDITGTIFGGGEANASGSEIFDWSFISVTNGIDMVIDGSGHNTFSSTGSIFGSGNASSSGGVSNLTIRNYGTRANPQKNISIQRANHVVISNSVIDFSGIADRTNVEFSDTPFTIARVDDLKIKNNTVLYLQTGTNYLKSFGSYVDVTTNGNTTEELATVVINDETGAITSRNVDNRLYVWEGKNINIANDLNVTSFGPVSGMTFFGLFNHDRNGNVVTALYDPSYNNGDDINSNDLGYFSDGGYVMGLHKTNHNIKVDGFYSNQDNERNAGHIKTFYIDPTPPDGPSYKWVVGALVNAYTIELVASKYSTLGGVELALADYSAPDITFSILGFNYNELDSDVELVDTNTIPRVASSGALADTVMGLVMQTSNVGWKNNALTTFKTDPQHLVTGNRDYIAESSNVIPSLIFFLYHSKNLSTAADMGRVTVSLQVDIPINAISSKVERLNINIDLSRKLISTNEYEGTITAGKKYEIFANTTTNVTTDSSISTYFGLYVESENPVYGAGYYHALVSTLVFPENTKITMINYATQGMPEYYYYVVSASDVTAAQTEYNLYGEASYRLDKFLKMGSSNPNNNYDEASHNASYYNTTLKTAEEEFVFIVDFEESGITTNQLNKTLFIELRNANNQTLINVLGTQQQVMKYSLYANSGAEIEVTSSMSNNPVYLGQTAYFTATTAVHQQTLGSTMVQDTNTFNEKLGIKVTIYDNDNHQVDGYSLMGVYLELNGVRHYPRIDGSYRIKLADRMVNVTARMKFGTENSSLASGHYKIKVESFGSADGIYYGLVANDSAILDFDFVNAVYGLKVTTNEKVMFIDKTTGKTLNDNNTLSFTTQYNSTLINPSLRVSLYRRDYTTEYSTNYVLVDLQDYVTNRLTTTNESKVYLLTNNPPTNFPTYYTTKPNLVSGTYKLVVSIYDNGIYIGDSHIFIFIK